MNLDRIGHDSVRRPCVQACALFRRVAPLLLVAAVGCSSHASSVRADSPFTEGQGDALVMGKVGVTRDKRDKPRASYYFEVRRMSDDKVFRINPDEQTELEGVWGAPFFVRLPPGQYAVGKWRVESLDGSV